MNKLVKLEEEIMTTYTAGVVSGFKKKYLAQFYPPYFPGPRQFWHVVFLLTNSTISTLVSKNFVNPADAQGTEDLEAKLRESEGNVGALAAIACQGNEGAHNKKKFIPAIEGAMVYFFTYL